ncbi:TPA: ParA family protein [Pseudomonas aeruginosa]|nr:ParA family protein [Pseudomonas aeruginosa]
MSKRLVLFNHKGGVSKTTTVYNIGWMLAERHKVLLVDGDPQCNLTSLILRDGFDNYYLDEATKLNNLKDGVSPAFDGKPVPIKAIECPVSERIKNLHLLPGHANLSAYDAALTLAQNSNNAISTLQNLPGAFSELIRLVEERYEIDYTIIDLNPGLSSINQSLFLNSDVFVLPTNPDPFSIMAIETLAGTLPRWAAWKNNALADFASSAYPLRLNIPKFGGTLIQRFNIRNGKAARPYRDNIDEIKQVTNTKLIPALSRAAMVFPMDDYPAELKENNFCLSEIQDFGGLLPKAFGVGVPVFALTDEEIAETGPVLEALQRRREQLRFQMNNIIEQLLVLLNHD